MLGGPSIRTGLSYCEALPASASQHQSMTECDVTTFMLGRAQNPLPPGDSRYPVDVWARG